MTNHLATRRQELGLSPSAMARRARLSPANYLAFENGQRLPIWNGQWTPMALRLAQVHALEPAELWPDAALIVEAPRLAATPWTEPVQCGPSDPTELATPDLLTDTISTAWLTPADPDHLAVIGSLRAVLNRALASLKPREERVLRLRYGLGGEALTLRATGIALFPERQPPLSPERIRQTEAKALRKLRHPSRAKRLKAFWPQRHVPIQPTRLTPTANPPARVYPPWPWHPCTLDTPHYCHVERHTFPCHQGFIGLNTNYSPPRWHWWVVASDPTRNFPVLAQGWTTTAEMARALASEHLQRWHDHWIGKETGPPP